MAQAEQVKDTRLPFRFGARWRESFVGKIDYEAGAEKSLRLKNVGFVNHLICHFEADVSVGGSPALHEDGLFALIKQIEVQINISSANPIKLSGYGIRLKNMLDRYGYAPHLGGVGRAVPQTNLYNAPIANSGTNKWKCSFIVPIGMNSHRESDIGCLPMFARGLQADFIVTWRRIEDVLGGTSPAITNAKIYVEQGYFEMPNPQKVKMPSFFVIKRYEQSQGSVLAGDNTVTIPQEGRLLALAHILRINGQRSDKWTEHKLYQNENDTPYRQSQRSNLLKNRKEIGIDLESGVMLQNFMNADNSTFSGSPHQTFDVGRISTFDSILVVADDAPLSVNPSLNTISTIRTLIQPLIVPNDMV